MAVRYDPLSSQVVSWGSVVIVRRKLWKHHSWRNSKRFPYNSLAPNTKLQVESARPLPYKATYDEMEEAKTHRRLLNDDHHGSTAVSPTRISSVSYVRNRCSGFFEGKRDSSQRKKLCCWKPCLSSTFYLSWHLSDKNLNGEPREA